MRVLTGEEMRLVEQSLREDLGISSLLLMENAARGIAEVLQEEYGLLENKKIHILAGPGNNGGDGLVLARQLLAKGARPKVYLVGDPQKFTPETRTNLKILQKIFSDFVSVEGGRASRLKFSLNMADLIVDALLGTGFRGQLRKELAALVDLVNEVQRPLVSIDIPTGVEADSGRVGNTAIRADHTVNLGSLKVGTLLYPGRAYAGKNICVDLGVPLPAQPTLNRFLLQARSLDWLPQREPWGHKGTFGHVLVVGGSRQLAGAAALCGEAVLRGGAGLVTVAVPAGIAQRFPPDELMVVPLPETEDATLGSASLPHLEQLLLKKDVLVIGPGLSQHPEVSALVQRVLEAWEGPAVIDADGLRVLTEEFLASMPPKKRRQWVLTPHPGEMGRLVGVFPSLVNENRLEIGEKFSKKWGVVLVLKGAPTVVFSTEKTYLNSTGNHGLATGGTGDILAGLIGAFLAQKMNPLQAAALGVYVHGLAGDLAGAAGRRGLMAGDCLKKIQEILK